MTQGKRRFTYISFIGQRRYNHANYRFSQNTNERQIVLALSHQWLKEIRQNVMQFRDREFYTKIFAEQIIENNRKVRPYKITKKIPL